MSAEKKQPAGKYQLNLLDLSDGKDAKSRNQSQAKLVEQPESSHPKTREEHKKRLPPIKIKKKMKESKYDNATLITKLVDDIVFNQVKIPKRKNLDELRSKIVLTEETEHKSPFITETSQNTKTQPSQKEDTSDGFSHQFKKEQSKAVLTQAQIDNRRLRTYQPRIDSNWKERLGLKHKTNKILPSLMNSIEFQAKTIEEHVKLLLDNITYYKMSIVHDNHFHSAFNNMKHKMKVAYNRDIEELCGIMLLIPQLLLMEFYQYVEKFNNVKLVDPKKFRDKYIYDEGECLYHNLSVVTDLVDFLRSSYDVYLTLVKQVDDMLFKGKKYDNIICILEKARYDISSIIKRSENAIKIYTSDLAVIKKYRPEVLLSEDDNAKQGSHLTKSENLTDKMRGQFIFKNNDERQRISRINNTLTQKREDYEEEPEEKKEVVVNREVHSIVKSKLISNLLPYCKKDVKHKIISKRIHDELRGNKEVKDDKQIVSLNF